MPVPLIYKNNFFTHFYIKIMVNVRILSGCHIKSNVKMRSRINSAAHSAVTEGWWAACNSRGSVTILRRF